MKPKIRKDWDPNRLIVTTPYGDELVLFKERAMEVYNAGLRVYKKRGTKK
jgi:hypothetical protein